MMYSRKKTPEFPKKLQSLMSPDWQRSNWTVSEAKARLMILSRQAGEWYEFITERATEDQILELGFLLATLGLTPDMNGVPMSAPIVRVDVRHLLKVSLDTWEAKAHTINLIAFVRAGLLDESLEDDIEAYYISKANTSLAYEIAMTGDVDAFFSRPGYSRSPEQIRQTIAEMGELATADSLRKMIERFAPDT